jgi:hypothetical protein
MSPSMRPELVLRPALCLLGIPLGVGIPDFSSVSLRAVGVATLLPSLLLPVSTSRSDMDNDCEWLCPDMPLKELRGRCMRPLIEALE